MQPHNMDRFNNLLPPPSAPGPCAAPAFLYSLLLPSPHTLTQAMPPSLFVILCASSQMGQHAKRHPCFRLGTAFITSFLLFDVPRRLHKPRTHTRHSYTRAHAFSLSSSFPILPLTGTRSLEAIIPFAAAASTSIVIRHASSGLPTPNPCAGKGPRPHVLLLCLLRLVLVGCDGLAPSGGGLCAFDLYRCVHHHASMPPLPPSIPPLLLERL